MNQSKVYHRQIYTFRDFINFQYTRKFAQKMLVMNWWLEFFPVKQPIALIFESFQFRKAFSKSTISFQMECCFHLWRGHRKRTSMSLNEYERRIKASFSKPNSMEISHFLAIWSNEYLLKQIIGRKKSNS